MTRSVPTAHVTSMRSEPRAPMTCVVPSVATSMIPPSTASSAPGLAVTRTLPLRVEMCSILGSAIAGSLRSCAMALTEEEQTKWRERFRKIMVGTNFIKGLGVTVEAWSPDEVVLRVPFAEHLTNDGREYHGGVIASLVDTTGAAAVWAGHDFDKGMRASTVSMTINYTGRASGDL